MIIHLHDNLTLVDLQDRFSKCFQFLKIEFYSKPHLLHKGSLDENRISPDKLIGQVRKNRAECELVIYSWYTVAKVKHLFKEKTGLNVQVFRKEAGAWIQTTKTDDYTLREQNEMACHAANSLTPKFSDQYTEYDEL